MTIDLGQIVRRVRLVEPVSGREPSAAVAAILREGPEVLLIKRAEHPDDPWSGHMAFPGGRREPGDASLVHTARRETLEEIGLDLEAHGELAGPLHDVPTHLHGMLVRPFVWRVESVPALRPNREVASVGWADLRSLMSGERDTTYPFTYRGRRHEFPAYEVDQGIVWGLTYRMLQTLFEVLRTG